MLINKLEILEELIVLERKEVKLMNVLRGGDEKYYTVRLDVSDDDYCSDSEVFNVGIDSLRLMLECELETVNEKMCNLEEILVKNKLIYAPLTLKDSIELNIYEKAFNMERRWER